MNEYEKQIRMEEMDNTFTEFFSILKKIEREEIRIVNRFVPSYGEDDCHALCECFVTDNGWLFSVFNDNGDWDYVNCIHSPEGKVLQYKDINCWDESLGDNQNDDRIILMNYMPSQKVWQEIYQPFYK
jgi:hypothetical protein